MKWFDPQVVLLSEELRSITPKKIYSALFKASPADRDPPVRNYNKILEQPFNI
jgi:hypothetical protein